MALENFIPEVWSARLLVNLYNTLVYGNPRIINSDYEGEIRNMGDTVRINSIGAVTVGDYTKNTDMAAPQTLSDAQTTLTITQQKFFNFQVDDIDKFQQMPKMMNDAMREAAYALGNTADQFIAGLYTDIPAGNILTAADGTTAGSDATPILIKTAVSVATTDQLAYEMLVDASVKMDENNVPAEGRWVVVPPWYEGYLLKDARFVAYGTPQNRTALMDGSLGGGDAPATGFIGRVAGFDVFKSNNVPIATNAYQMIAGHGIGWTWANQIDAVEAYRPERRFADAIKGLQLYGAKMTRPQVFALGKVKKG